MVQAANFSSRQFQDQTKFKLDLQLLLEAADRSGEQMATAKQPTV